MSSTTPPALVIAFLQEHRSFQALSGPGPRVSEWVTVAYHTLFDTEPTFPIIRQSGLPFRVTDSDWLVVLEILSVESSLSLLGLGLGLGLLLGLRLGLRLRLGLGLGLG